MAVSCSTCGTTRTSAEEPCPQCSAQGTVTGAEAETLPLPAADSENLWSAETSAAENHPATIAGRYRVVSELGRGGFGVVFRALDERLGREIAIKRLTQQVDPESKENARFEREARILASLDHPNIVPIFDAGLDGDRPFIAMKLVAGRTLSERLRDGPMEEAEALQIFRHVAAGLSHAHSRGILHRDVKPSNVLEDRDGRIFLADFGLGAGELLPKITQRGTMIGTLDYMAPEALSGECDERSDLYSLGAVLYEMVFGEPCFDADSARVLYWKICSETPSYLVHPPPGLSKTLLTLMRRLLVKDPIERPESVEEVRAEVERLFEPTPDPGVSYSAGTPVVSSSTQDDLPPADELAKLEPCVDELVKLAERDAVSLDRLLKPLTHFIFSASHLVKQLARTRDAEENRNRHALTLSLLHLAREVERRVEALEPTEGDEASLRGNLIHLQVRVLAPATELLAELESLGQKPPAPDDFFAFDSNTGEAPRDDTEWIDELTSRHRLRRHEAALTITGSGLEVFLRELRSRPVADRDCWLDALWQQADVLLLEGRGRSRPVFEAAVALASEPSLAQKWRTLFSLFQGAGGSYWDPLMVRPMLAEQVKSDLRVFGRALLIHPWESYRRLALEILRPRDFWVAIAHERLPLDWLLELWRHLRDQVGDDYLKIFFVCIKDRLAQPAEAGRIVAAVELIKELFKVDCFHETLFFKMLTDLESHVRAEARLHGLLADFDSEYVSRIQAFRERPARPDEPVKAWSRVPLPIQRLLARRGHFQKHFACHPIDPIALECLPHIMVGEDVSGFLKLAGLNARLLNELAKEERLYQNEHNKYLLVANPKTPPFIVAKHIGYLRGDSLNKLVHSHECNRFAHEYATRLLDKRGRLRGKPNLST